MISLKRNFCDKFFWLLFFLGLNLSMGQMPFDLPFLAFLSLIMLGFLWTRYQPLKVEAFNWGLGFGLGYFSITFFWIVEPFFIEPLKTGLLAPFALIIMVGSLSLILSACFFYASKLGNGRNKTQRLMILWLFLLLSEFIRSQFIFSFPWGLISSIWINTPIAQALALFGPHWLSAIPILSAFLISTPWVGSILGLSMITILYGFGYDRLNLPEFHRLDQIMVRIVQPNVEQSDKWKPELAGVFLNKHIEMSKSAKENGVDLIVWPETSISYTIQKEKNVRQVILEDLGVPLVLGARRFDTERNKIFNSAFLLASDRVILDVYDKIRLVPFGEYIPFGDFLARFNIFGLATDGIIGFSSGESVDSFETDELGVFKILICYEAIFSADLNLLGSQPSWILHITNDAWFGTFSGPQQHLILARMRAIEQGIPIVRSANTGISAVIDSRGNVDSSLGLGVTGYLDVVLPPAFSTTLYSRLGEKVWNYSLIGLLILTIGSLIFIRIFNKTRNNIAGKF